MTAAKAQGKALAITAEHYGTDSLLKNPAGLDHIDRPEISSTYGSFFSNFLQVSSISLGLPITEKVKFGLALPVEIISNIPKTIDSSGVGVQTDTFDDIDAAIIAGISIEILEDTLTLGASTTYTHHTINDTQGTGISYDVGLLWDTGIGTLGLSAQNIGKAEIKWDTGTKEIIEEKYNVGFSTELPLLDTVSIDCTKEGDKDLTYHLGIEKKLSPALTIQAGIQNLEKEKTLTLGASLDLDSITINYAFQNNEVLGNCYTVGLQIKF